MNYDFNTLVDRTGTGSWKWDAMLREYPETPRGTVPFSTADMELKPAPEIIEGLKTYLTEQIPGYTGPTDAYYEAVQHFMERRHGYRPERDWFVTTPGIVPALYDQVRAFSSPEDSILITPPVYGPFFGCAKGNGRNLVESPLVLKGDHYNIDFDDFEQKASLPEVKLFILCNPHNPCGRVWTREELTTLSDICLRHGVFVISDEIHSDLIMPGETFVSMATLPERYVQNSLVCTAISKTFNLAGLQASNVFVPDPDRRKLLKDAGGYSSLNVMGYVACRLAYTCGEPWLDQLLVHLKGNRDYLHEYLEDRLPELVPHRLQGTYLQWVDFHALGLSAEELKRFTREKARLFFNEGTDFGVQGAGFERWNLACPRWVLEEALERLEKAVKALKR